jgi:putative SOS response-associated peptidase YedK
VFEERPDIGGPMPADFASKFLFQMSSANGAASTGVFPDYPAPVVRNAGTERELVMMRWGMPPPPRARACHQYSQHLVSALAGLAQT